MVLFFRSRGPGVAMSMSSPHSPPWVSKAWLARLPLALLLALLLLCLCTGRVGAGELDKAALQSYFPAPLIVGEKDAQLAIWPIFKPPGSPVDVVPSIDVQGRTVWPFGQTASPVAGKPILMGYAFESVDIAPVPGYSGKVINMLISVDLKGKFLDVRLLSHKEPLFVGGLGDKLMGEFAGQYRGLSVKQTIRLVNARRHRQAWPSSVVFRGVRSPSS
jgi:NosR/NirI family transcriptional regulator, nitrous oxide reductase regulator